MSTHIDELLEIFIEIRQVVFPLLIIRDEALLFLQQALPLLFERQTLSMLVLDARDSQPVLVCLGVLWVLR